MDTITLRDAEQRPSVYPVETTAADLARARDADAPISAAELLRRCQRAASDLRCDLSAAEREDLAQVLAERVRERFGWTPQSRQVSLRWLRWRAADIRADVVGLWDQGGRMRPDGHGKVWSADALQERAEREAEAESEASEAGIMALAEHRARRGEPLPHVSPAPDVDADALADALRLTPNERSAVRAALSGWGSARALALAEGIEEPAARKRLERGRKGIERRYPSESDLRAAVREVEPELADHADPDGARYRHTRAERDALAAIERSRYLAERDDTRRPSHLGGRRDAATDRALTPPSEAAREAARLAPPPWDSPHARAARAAEERAKDARRTIRAAYYRLRAADWQDARADALAELAGNVAGGRV